MRIAVLGMGNVLMGDDAFGPYVVEVLKARYEIDPAVDVIDVGTPGLDLSPYMTDLDTLILVDTVRADAPAGTLRFYDKATLLKTPLQPRFSPHDPGFGECLTLLEIAGRAPREVLLAGVVPRDCEFRSGLSPAVRAAVDPMIAAVARELESRGVKVVPKAAPCEAEIWWEQEPCLSGSGD